MTIQYVISQNSITFYDHYHNSYSVNKDHFNFLQIRELLLDEKATLNQIIDLASIQSTILNQIYKYEESNYLPRGTITINNRIVYYDGVEVVSTCTEKLIGSLKDQGDIQPWILFMENLYLNPNHSSRIELYDWMESCNLPITVDGHFLAFKKVTNDYKDYHTGSFDNSIGTIVELNNRFEVDHVRTRTCSNGLHFCSHSYLDNFYKGGGRVVVLKINPADVVSIPVDYNYTKGRCWRYTVIGEIDESIIKKKIWPDVTTWTDPIFEKITN